MPLELLIFLLTERSLCLVLPFMSPSLVKIRPCSAYQGSGCGMENPSSWVQWGSFDHRVPLWPQAGSLDLFLLQFLYYEGHIDRPHRGVVRINKCWYSALEMRRRSTNAKNSQVQGKNLYTSISLSVWCPGGLVGKEVERPVCPSAPYTCRALVGVGG